MDTKQANTTRGGEKGGRGTSRAGPALTMTTLMLIAMLAPLAAWAPLHDGLPGSPVGSAGAYITGGGGSFDADMSALEVVAGADITTGSPGVYDIHENITISDGDTLTVGPAEDLWFDPGTGLIIRGTLVVDGTASTNARFMSGAGSPAAGDWRGIVIESGGSASIHQATIQYARAGVRALSADSLEVDNSTISTCYKGIVARDTTPVDIHGNKVSTCNRTAVFVQGSDGGTGTARVHGNELHHCTEGLWTVQCESVRLFDNHIHNNTRGMRLKLTNHSFVGRNVLVDNLPGAGFEEKDSALGLNWSNSISIKYNYIRDSRDYGIMLNTSSDVTIHDNEILKSEDAGLGLFDADGVTVTNCEIAKNTVNIIQLDNATDILVRDCVLGPDPGLPVHIHSIGESRTKILNCTFDDSRLSFGDEGSRLHIQWYLHIHLIDALNETLEGGTIEVYNKNDVEVGAGTSDAAGDHMYTICTERISSSAGNDHSMNPYMVKASTAADGWEKEVYVAETHWTTLVLNNAPELLAIPDTAIEEDSADAALYDLWEYYTDEEEDAELTFAIVFANNQSLAPAVLGANRYIGVDAFDGPINDNWTGRVKLQVSATDMWNETTLSGEFFVEITPMNDEPQAQEEIPDQEFDEDSNVSVYLPAYDFFVDGDGDALYYDAEVDPDAKTKGEDMEAYIQDDVWLHIRGGENWTGEASVRVYCDDDPQIERELYQDIDVLVKAVNDAPTISGIPDAQMVEDLTEDGLMDMNGMAFSGPFVMSVYAGDIDTSTGQLRFTMSVMTNYTYFQARLMPGDIFEVTTIKENWYGDALINITVSDGSMKAWDHFHVFVLPVNDDPWVTVTYPQGEVNLSGKVTLKGDAGDPDSILARVMVTINGDTTKKAGGTDSWTLNVNTLNFPNGQMNLSIIAYDMDGGASPPAYINFTVYNTNITPITDGQDGDDDKNGTGSDDKKGVNMALVGGIAGVVAVVVILLVLFIFMKKKKMGPFSEKEELPPEIYAGPDAPSYLSAQDQLASSEFGFAPPPGVDQAGGVKDEDAFLDHLVSLPPGSEGAMPSGGEAGQLTGPDQQQLPPAQGGMQPMDGAAPQPAPTGMQPMDGAAPQPAPIGMQPMDGAAPEPAPTGMQPMDGASPEPAPTGMQPTDGAAPQPAPAGMQPTDGAAPEPAPVGMETMDGEGMQPAPGTPPAQ